MNISVGEKNVWPCLERMFSMAWKYVRGIPNALLFSTWSAFYYKQQMFIYACLSVRREEEWCFFFHIILEIYTNFSFSLLSLSVILKSVSMNLMKILLICLIIGNLLIISFFFFFFFIFPPENCIWFRCNLWMDNPLAN